MPLVILGIIVVIGACLMIYYQIGPTLKTRIRTPYRPPSSPEPQKEKAFGGYIDLEPDPDFVEVSDDEDEDEDEDKEKTYGKSSDGKVLYIFDKGKTEIRPLDEDREKDKEEE